MIPPQSPAPASRVRIAVLLCLAAVAIRAVQFGNPVVQWDEQFYLVVGNRIWAGDWPYVAAWDRKPVGLFLIYAGARALGGNGVLAYQLVATACAAGTAFLVSRMASTIASARAALIAGLLYLILLMANGGDGGQAPVFYNLFVAGAAAVMMRICADGPLPRRSGLLACGAMALVGVALQIKYSVVFEGLYFGVVLIALFWRSGGERRRLYGFVPLWIALALAPTLLALLAYVAAGEGQAFVFANFLSIFQRARSMGGDAVPRLAKILLHTLPVVVLAIVSAARNRRWHGHAAVRRLVLGWCGAAIAGLLLFGTYHDHYALPLLVPLAVCAAPAFDARFGRWVAAAALVASVALAVVTVARNRVNRGTGRDVEALAARIRPHGADGLFVFNGDPVLYLLTGTRPPTRWYFPTFLSETRDAGTLGTDHLRELARVIATRPRFVVTRDYPFAEADAPAWRLMDHALAARYCLVARYRLRTKTVRLFEDARAGGASSCHAGQPT